MCARALQTVKTNSLSLKPGLDYSGGMHAGDTRIAEFCDVCNPG